MSAATDGVTIRKIEFADMPNVDTYIVAGDRYDTFLECIGMLVLDGGLTVKLHSGEDDDGVVEALVYGETYEETYDSIKAICHGY